MNILLMASPAAPLTVDAHIGLASGGVRAATLSMVDALRLGGHTVDLVAPEGSDANLVCYPVAGQCLSIAHLPDHYPIAADSVLAAMWEQAFALAPQYDLILNMAHDWLPLYLMPFFPIPVLSILNMSADNRATKAIIRQRMGQFPNRIAVHSQAQLASYEADGGYVFPLSIPVADYRFYPKAEEDALVTLTRISAEKGIEESAQLARATGHKLVVYGVVQNAAYWQNLQDQFADTIDYRGVLQTHEVQATLGRFKALLFTPQWIEAFGLVVLEAMACSLPVIANDSGGHAEVIRSGETGWIFPKGDLAQGQAAIERIGQISRQDCRTYVEQNYDIAASAGRLSQWFVEAGVA